METYTMDNGTGNGPVSRRSDGQRTLIISDVHGCYKELELLLKEVGADPKYDRILFIGDLINKGPSSRGVWEIFKRLDAISLIGNHELSALELAEGKRHSHSKYFDTLQKDFGRYFGDFIHDLHQWPLWWEDKDLVLVHAGLVPGLHPNDTEAWPLVTIRTWDGEGDDLKNPDNPPWFDFYKGEELVVFGHWAALGGHRSDKVIGIDTGCVYGGSLSCLILPERRLVQVKALETYAPIK